MAHDVENGLDGVPSMWNVAIDDAGAGEQTELVAALGEQAVEQGRIDAVGRAKASAMPAPRFLVEIEAGGAEGQIEIGDDRVGGDSVRDMIQPTLWAMVLEPTPPLAPTKATMRPIGSRLGIVIEGGDRFDDLQLAEAAPRDIR